MAVDTKKGYAQSGASSGATNGDTKNVSNGVGTDVTISIGVGHEIYTETSGGAVKKERLSEGDMLDHELMHGIAQMNGESVEGGDKMKNEYKNDKGEWKTEYMPEEEYRAIFGHRPPSKKMPGYKYTSENELRAEQGKNKRKNYYEY
jgi:hypothetical protein